MVYANLGEMVPDSANPGHWKFVNVQPTRATSVSNQAQSNTDPLASYNAQRAEMARRNQAALTPYKGPAPSTQFPAMANEAGRDEAGHTYSIRAPMSKDTSNTPGQDPGILSSIGRSTIGRQVSAFGQGIVQLIGDALTIPTDFFGTVAGQINTDAGRSITRIPDKIASGVTGKPMPASGPTRQTNGSTGSQGFDLFGTLSAAWNPPSRPQSLPVSAPTTTASDWTTKPLPKQTETNWYTPTQSKYLNPAVISPISTGKTTPIRVTSQPKITPITSQPKITPIAGRPVFPAMSPRTTLRPPTPAPVVPARTPSILDSLDTDWIYDTPKQKQAMLAPMWSTPSITSTAALDESLRQLAQAQTATTNYFNAEQQRQQQNNAVAVSQAAGWNGGGQAPGVTTLPTVVPTLPTISTSAPIQTTGSFLAPCPNGTTRTPQGYCAGLFTGQGMKTGVSSNNAVVVRR